MKITNCLHRAMSVFLALVLVFSMVPITAFAGEAPTFTTQPPAKAISGTGGYTVKFELSDTSEVEYYTVQRKVGDGVWDSGTNGDADGIVITRPGTGTYTYRVMVQPANAGEAGWESVTSDEFEIGWGDGAITSASATVTNFVAGKTVGDLITTDSSEDYDVTFWRVFDDETDYWMNSGDVFVEGKTYNLQFDFTPKNWKAFEYRPDLVDDTNGRVVTINGEEATQESIDFGTYGAVYEVFWVAAADHEHVFDGDYKWVDYDGHARACSVANCDTLDTANKVPHVDADSNGACDVCTGVMGHTEDTSAWHDCGDGVNHYHKCTVSGCQAQLSPSPHVYNGDWVDNGDGTCSQECACGALDPNGTPHTYNSIYNADCNKCGALRNIYLTTGTIDDVDFGTVENSDDVAQQNPVVTNTGEGFFSLTYAKVELTAGDVDAFNCGWLQGGGDLDPGDTTDKAWVSCKDGLAPGTYTATLTLYYDADGSSNPGCDYEVMDTCTVTVTVHQHEFTGPFEWVDYDGHARACSDPNCDVLDTANKAPHVDGADSNGACDVCGDVMGHTEDSSAWFDCGDGANHYRKCTVSGCQAQLQKSAHTYDNAQDTECNDCGATRAAHTHDFTSGQWKDNGDGTCSQKCAGCDEYGTPAAHNYTYYNNGDDGHYGLCQNNGCGYQTPVAPHDYDDEQDDQCNTCPYTRHICQFTGYYVSQGEAGHGRHCFLQACEELDPNVVPHVYDDPQDTECNDCGYIRTLGHQHDFTSGQWQDDGNDVTCSQKCTGCDEYGGATGHVYSTNDDTECNHCGYHKHIFLGDWVKVDADTCARECLGLACAEIGPASDHDYTGDWVDNGDDTCSQKCGHCGEAKNPQGTDHIYDDAQDTDCNNCGAIRTVAPPPHNHVYDGAWEDNGDGTCSQKCACGEAKNPQGTDHVYDDAQDTDCNNCGATRTVAPPPHNHVYDGAWEDNGDGTCSQKCACGEAKNPQGTDHIYDDAQDTDCNNCGATRTVAPPPHNHVYDGAWRDNQDGTCSQECACGEAKNPQGTDHIYDDAQDTDCNNCGATRTVAPPPHNHVYDGAWRDNQDGTCSQECGCFQAVDPVRTPHSYDNDQDADCNRCFAIRNVNTGHQHDFTGPWLDQGAAGCSRQCTDPNCGESDPNLTPHVDGDDDDHCDNCDYEMFAINPVPNGPRPYYPEGVSPVYYVNPEEDPNYVPPTNPGTGAVALPTADLYVIEALPVIADLQIVKGKEEEED